MIPGSSLDALAARWATRTEPGVFAALAEGLAKRGDLAEAARVVSAGLARYPGHAAGLVAQARIASLQGDRPLAARALALLLDRDPGHPLALELAGELAPELLTADDEPAAQAPTADMVAEDSGAGPSDVGFGEASATVVTVDGADLTEAEPDAADQVPTADETRAESEDDPEPLPIVTESLAALYHQQGHLEEALAAYAELAARDPSNDTVAARHEALRREMLARRPLPFDVRESGGRSVAEWLAAVAAAQPTTGRADGSFDAFYEPPPAPADATADFDAFQRWLEELAR